MPTGATRRGLVASAAAAAVAQALPSSWPGAIATADARAKRCAPRPAGVRRSALAVSRDGRTLWTADTGATSISAHRAGDLTKLRSVDVGASPLDIAISPSGGQALVTTGFYGRHGLTVVDLRAAKVRRRADVGTGAHAVAFAPDGRAYVAGGGEHGRLLRVDPRRGAVEASVDLGRDPRGLAFTPHGRYALVALNGDAQLAVVALDTFDVVGRIATAPFPYLVAAAPDSARAYVSHNGFGSSRVSILDVRAGRATGKLAVGPDPAGLAITRTGGLLVAERGRGTVSVYDPRSGRRRRHYATGGWP
ncbi:MAG: repeat-containing proteinYVTN family beta-propeller repeat protein, partial [Solirubrobacteraceae bacterium]|nr:repeat-containing proteinYVTN family beta-propeller repeat protein [Solirubrobacteraceae bacterium]